MKAQNGAPLAVLVAQEGVPERLAFHPPQLKRHLSLVTRLASGRVQRPLQVEAR